MFEDLAPLELIREAQDAIKGTARRTPLIRLEVDAPCEIYLKLENLQPVGAFKIRGAAFGVAKRTPEQLEKGVWAASSGNMAYSLSYVSRQLSIPCTVLMPDTATDAKVAAVERMGGKAVRVSYEDWWQSLIDRDYPGVTGEFFHGFDDVNTIAANGTIGVEILEDLPDVDTVVVPFGGGGLACGVGSALKHLGSKAQVLGAEYDAVAPLGAALEAGEPVDVPGKPPKFLGGVGGPNVVASMWPRTLAAVDGAVEASIGEIAEAIYVLTTEARIVSEGAGAVALACATAGRAGSGKVVCVVSGGNIDPTDLATILRGEIPGG